MGRRRHVPQLHRGHRRVTKQLALAAERQGQTELTVAVQHPGGGRAEGFDIEPGLYGGKLGLELAKGLDEAVHRHHRVDDDGQFRLQAAGQARRLGPEASHLLGDSARPGQQGPAGLGQGRAVGGPVEQGRAHLRLETLHGVGHRRLGPVQAPGGGGKAAGVDDGEKHLDLVERQTIGDHVPISR